MYGTGAYGVGTYGVSEIIFQYMGDVPLLLTPKSRVVVGFNGDGRLEIRPASSVSVGLGGDVSLGVTPDYGLGVGFQGGVDFGVSPLHSLIGELAFSGLVDLTASLSSGIRADIKTVAPGVGVSILPESFVSFVIPAGTYKGNIGLSLKPSHEVQFIPGYIGNLSLVVLPISKHRVNINVTTAGVGFALVPDSVLWGWRGALKDTVNFVEIPKDNTVWDKVLKNENVFTEG